MPRPSPIKAAAAARGLTLNELADNTGYSRQTIGQISRGNVASWPKIRHALADELGQPEAVLFPEAVDRLLAERAEQGHGEGFSSEVAAAITNIVARGGDGRE